MASITDAWNLYSQLVLANSSYNSRISEEGRWNLHIAAHFGADHAIQNITSKSLLELRVALTSKHLSPQTVMHCLSLLRRVLNRAVEWGLSTDPIPSFKMPKFDNRRLRFLTPEEAKRLIMELSITSQLWHDITLFALHTGLRAGELLRLRPCHFDRRSGLIHVLDTKTSENRTIPLNNIARDVLHRREKLRGEYIFTDHDKQITYITRTFRRAVEACKLNSHTNDRRQKVVFHTLRHTFASWMVQQGVPLAVVGQLLGHRSMQMTMRYAHLAPAQGVTAVKSLEPLMDEPTASELSHNP
ncbi:MAG: site-specific integrase [Desulfovibrionaceae bacterium]|nr:site-specific integrase [Desulfovibrionaceae bacterium]